jgi:hypothetical protein
MTASLFGEPAGRRREHVEYGLRYPDGQVSQVSEYCARHPADVPGMRGVRAVQRTVVTYTGRWEAMAYQHGQTAVEP